MNAASGRVGWRQLREFADVDLTKSYVLSWRVESEVLVVDVDLFLEPAHPFYEPPRPAEKVCIRPAIIEFPCCSGLACDRLPVGEVIELSGKIGHGVILDLSVVGDGRYEIRGEFGTVSINAERPILKLKRH